MYLILVNTYNILKPRHDFWDTSYFPPPFSFSLSLSLPLSNQQTRGTQSCVANNLCASQEIPHLLWNSKMHCCSQGCTHTI
jgi:hypothetical protein